MKHLSIHAAAEKYGDAPALRFHSQTYSFSELADTCRPLCSQFEKLPSTQMVETSATNHPDTVITLLAALHCKKTIAMIPKDISTSALPPSDLPLSDLPSSDLPSSKPTEQAHCILFTSGSSAAPKGVILPESALIASAKASEANLGWRPDDQWILNLPLAHIGGLSILFRCLLAGKCVHLHERFSDTQVVEAITEHGATMISLVPTTLHRLMASGHARALKQLRVILLGGAAASDALRHQWKALKLPVLETYGMTETASQVATTPLSSAMKGIDTGMKPLKGVSVTIVDEGGSRLHASATGRIQIAGPMVMTGYVGMQPCNGTFSTEDSGYIDDKGFVHILGRMDSLIITGGENVHPTQVEEKLKCIEGVNEAVVFGVEDNEYGQIVAAALFVSMNKFNEERLTDFLKKDFSTHRRPRRIHIAPFDTLPLLENGKINRQLVISTASENLVNVHWAASSTH